MTHVAEVRATASAFEGWDHRYGGGVMREAAIAELRYCAELLNARCPDRVRGELMTALGLADEEFSRTYPADDPPLAIPYDANAHSANTGFALWQSGMHGQFVGKARDRMTAAVAGFGDARARGRTRSQIKLASLIMVTGDPREAAVLGTQALDTVDTLRSRRAADELRELRRFSEYHPYLTEVAELRHRIGTVLAVS